MGQTRYPSKSWVFKNRFVFEVRQHGQQQLYLQHQVCRMLGAPSFSKSCLCIQSPLQSQTKIFSSTSVNFHLQILPLLIQKTILTIPTNTAFLCTLAIFAPTNNLHQKIFSLPQPFSQFRLRHRTKESCEVWHCFNFSLLPQSMDSNNRANNHWFLTVQAHKIGVFQVVFSDEDACNWNSKLSKTPCLIPSTYCYYFHTLLIPSQELIFP